MQKYVVRNAVKLTYAYGRGLHVGQRVQRLPLDDIGAGLALVIFLFALFGVLPILF